MAPAEIPPGTFWKRGLPRFIRWLHIYLSMTSFALILFFAVTGLTLNHAEKFGGRVHSIEDKGNMNVRWVNQPDTNKIDKLAIVEFLRNQYRIHAALSDFRIDETQCAVSFKGPGYAADAFIDDKTGAYDIVQTSAGFIGILNDLHKGRDAGAGWGVFIDISAVFLALVSLTGLILLLYLKKRRTAGLLIAALGGAFMYIIYIIWVN
jgi:hypothetical protein